MNNFKKYKKLKNFKNNKYLKIKIKNSIDYNFNFDIKLMKFINYFQA